MSVIDDKTAASRRRARPRGGDGERRCVVTGRILPKARLLRLVVGPDRRLAVDLDERLPGRGVWLGADRETLAKAKTGRHFARALRGPVEVPDDLEARVEAGLATRAANLLGLARRAGAALAGFEKVRRALAGGKARLLIAARDGAEDGRAKLEHLAGNVPRARGLGGAELGAVFGRPFAVHAAVTDPAFAAGLERALARLEGVRGGIPEEDCVPGNTEVR